MTNERSSVYFMDFLGQDEVMEATRDLFERGLSLLYFVAFLSAYFQFPSLLGEKGLLPVTKFLQRSHFGHAPSIFHYYYTDKFFKVLAVIGLLLSLSLAFGLSKYLSILIHILLWLFLYASYLSIVNVGQDFYGFGWESMLLEMGFFMAFMGPSGTEASWVPIIILRWMLFRTEIGAGLIKLRGDKCWRDLTCLYYHHETQPLPNPLSRTFHHSPKVIHRFGVMFSHFVQLIAPFGLFLPQPLAAIAGAFIIFHQLILIISGNYAWLNWLTVVLGLLCFTVEGATPVLASPLWFQIIQWGIGGLALILSYEPLKNLFSNKQKMNYSWNKFHLVNAYGAFGSVTKKRYEIILSGTNDEVPSPDGKWLEYEFKGKPGDLKRMPPVVAPYHLRLDWMIWFLPFTVRVTETGILVWGHDEWFIRLVQKLLANDPDIRHLLRQSPFATGPKYIRALFYHYQFTTKEEFHTSGNIWKRTLIGEYLPPINLQTTQKALS